MATDLTNLLPDQKVIEQRFSFIEDEVLRTNIVITFRHIIFLINLEKNNQLPGSILYSLYKDIIVHTGTIIESCVHYLLDCHIGAGNIQTKEVMPEVWIEDKCMILEESDNGNRIICGIVKHKSAEKFTKHTQFIVLNRACFKSRLFNKSVFDKAEKIRKSRNRIHLAGLNQVDEFYTKKDVDEYFADANIVLTCIEEKLKQV